MKILIVEDEPKTGDYLKQGLVEAGFSVDLLRDGLDGLHHALTDFEKPSHSVVNAALSRDRKSVV